MLQKKIIKLLVFCETSFKFVSEVSPLPLQLFSFIMQLQKRLTGDMQVFLHTLFLEYTTETGGNKCKAKFGAVLAMFDFSEKSRGRSCPQPFNYTWD